MERRVDEPDDHRLAAHCAEEAVEIAPLHGEELGENRRALLRAPREDQLLHQWEPGGLKKHVLRAAEADSFGAERASALGIAWIVGVGPHLQRADTVRPTEELDEERVVERRDECRQFAEEHLPRRAVDGHPVALLELHRRS